MKYTEEIRIVWILLSTLCRTVGCFQFYCPYPMVAKHVFKSMWIYNSINKCKFLSSITGAVLNVWLLDLLLPVQLVSITTKVVSWNPVHGEVYSIQHYVIKFVSDKRQVDGFLQVVRFPPPIKLNTTIHLKCCWKWR